MAEMSGVEVLQNEIEKSKDRLKEYNENIRKLTGRDPNKPGIQRFLSEEGFGREDNDFSMGGRVSRGRGRIFGVARHAIMEDNGPPSKRRAIGGAFSRLGPLQVHRREREDSPDEDELPNKLSVHSSVVATSRDAKNRKEILQEQNKDKEGMQRNRRMFGLLLGTLNKFKTEANTLATKEIQRKKIEEKLEEKAEKEKRKFKQETKLLIEEMHLEQSKISRLQQKMEIVQEHTEREVEVQKLKNFIVTRTRPRIFWRPKQMSAILENKLKDSKKFVDGLLQGGRDRLEKEIKELMERETKREERIKMRLREDGLIEDKDVSEGTGIGGVGFNMEGVNQLGVDGGGYDGKIELDIKEELGEDNAVVERIDRQFEEGEVDDENENVRDIEIKARRTVVLEARESSGSEAEQEGIEQDTCETEVSKSQQDLVTSHSDMLQQAEELMEVEMKEAGGKMDPIGHLLSGQEGEGQENVLRLSEHEDDMEDSDQEAEQPLKDKSQEMPDQNINRNTENADSNKSSRSTNEPAIRKDKRKDDDNEEGYKEVNRKEKEKRRSKHESRDKSKSKKHRRDDRHEKDGRREREVRHEKEERQGKEDRKDKQDRREKEDRREREERKEKEERHGKKEMREKEEKQEKGERQDKGERREKEEKRQREEKRASKSNSSHSRKKQDSDSESETEGTQEKKEKRASKSNSSHNRKKQDSDSSSSESETEGRREKEKRAGKSNSSQSRKKQDSDSSSESETEGRREKEQKRAGKSTSHHARKTQDSDSESETDVKEEIEESSHTNLNLVPSKFDSRRESNAGSQKVRRSPDTTDDDDD